MVRLGFSSVEFALQSRLFSRFAWVFPVLIAGCGAVPPDPDSRDALGGPASENSGGSSNAGASNAQSGGRSGAGEAGSNGGAFSGGATSSSGGALANSGGALNSGGAFTMGGAFGAGGSAAGGRNGGGRGGNSGMSGGNTGMSGAAGMSGSNQTVCTSKMMWTGGNGPDMRPGNACKSCHSFSLAGTVFPTAHEPNNCNGTTGSTGVRVVITGADGNKITLTPGNSGNFNSQSQVKTPFTVELLNGTASRKMLTPQTSGDCNSCHTVNGANGAPGRIMAP